MQAQVKKKLAGNASSSRHHMNIDFQADYDLIQIQVLCQQEHQTRKAIFRTLGHVHLF
jgi:hypothetical protein